MSHCGADSTPVQSLTIANSVFRSNKGNKGVGMELKLQPRSQSHGEPKVLVTLTNCTFTENVGYVGLCIAEYSRPVSYFDVVIREASVSNNVLSWPLNRIPHYLSTGLFTAVTLVSVRNITISNSDFHDNGISALYAFGSVITFAGEVSFTGNTGINGGAMVLDGVSAFYLSNSTSVYFTNNSALVSGGAIFVFTHVDDPFRHACFFQVKYQSNLNESELDNYIEIRFKDNSALVSGRDIYGGAIGSCYLVSGPVFSENSLAVFNALFHFDSPPSDVPSTISSAPLFVCLCPNNVMDCDTQYTYNTSCYPGGTITLPLVAVGQLNGITGPATVRLYFNDGTNATVGDLENPQDTNSSCTNLSYTIFSPRRFEGIHFEVEGAVLLDTPRTINVTLLKCPPGFQLSPSSPYKCDCIPLLSRHEIKCHINDKSIRRTGHVWVGVSKEEVVLGDFCPLDYCIPYADKPYTYTWTNPMNSVPSTEVADSVVSAVAI